MTENENNIHQLKTATELAKGKVVVPCVSKSMQNGISQTLICPLLNISQGCTVGFVKEIGGQVMCPEEKGAITITSENITMQSEYANDIAEMELQLNREEHISLDMALFV